MKKSLAVLAVFLLVAIASKNTQAQEISQKIDGLKSMRYADWEKTFKDYFREKRALGYTQTKGTGFNQVSRVLWFHKDRLDTEGNIVNSDLYNWNAYKQFVQQNQAQPFASVSPQTAEWSYGSPGFARSTEGKANGIGRVTFVKLDPNDAANANSAIMYVGAPKGGLWRTTFNKSTGLVGTWTCLTDGLPNIGAVDIAINPNNRNIIYLVSGDKNAGVGNSPSGIGILKSTDYGATWAPTAFYDDTPPDFSYGTIRKILMDHSNPNRMWVATTQGIVRTEDGWQTFTTEQAGSFWDIEKGRNLSNQALIACTSSRVYTSNDYGASWTVVRNNANTADYTFSSNRAEIAVSPDFGSNRSFYLWYVTGNFDATTSNIKLYAGSSSTWTDHYSGNALVHVYDDYCMAFEVDPNQSNWVIAGGVTLKQSNTSGDAWYDINQGVSDAASVFSENIHADQHYVAWDQGFLFLGNDGGVYNWNNALGGWRFLSDGMHITQYYRISYVNNANGFRAMGGSQDNGTHNSSVRIGCCDGMESLINYDNIQTLYLSWQGASIRKSTDGGDNFTTFGPANFANDDVWTTAMAMHKTNPAIVAMGGYDNPNGRIDVFDGSWAAYGSSSGEYRWLSFAQSAPNVLYGVTSSVITKISDVTAASPTVTSYTLPASSATSVAVDPATSTHVFYTVGGYGANKVFESTNSGQNWTNITLNLPNVPVNCILEGPNNDIYIGTDIGVFVKLESWNYWAPFMNGLPNTRVTDLETDGGLLTCATYGRGRWFTNLYGACVPDLDLTAGNDPALGPITGYQYYTASDTISSTRIVQGELGTDVTYRAGNSVTLKPGFHAKESNDFKAILGPCFGGGTAPFNATDPNVVPFAATEPNSVDNERPRYNYMQPPIKW